MGRSDNSTSPLSPSEISSLSAKYFSPFIKPQRLPRQPKPPSLAWSKLPPPAAEIDERPTARVRRFRLWGAAAPELRIAVLDPRRRSHLIRYRTFVTPSPPEPHHGRLSRSTRSFQSIPRPLVQSRPPPYPASSAHHTSSSPDLSAAAPPKPPKLPKRERKRAHDRLLEHKWVLDQEHERRFRRGMAALLQEVMAFQEANTLPFEEWPKGSKWREGRIWKDGVDIGRVEEFTNFFSTIRKASVDIFQYLNPADIAPVPGRQAVHDQVKAEERRKRKRREKKEKKKREREAAELKVAKEAVQAGPVHDTSQVGHTLGEGAKELERCGKDRSEVWVERVPSSASETSGDAAAALDHDADGELPDTLDALLDRLLALREQRVNLLQRLAEKEQGRRRRESRKVRGMTEDETNHTDRAQDQSISTGAMSESIALSHTHRLNDEHLRPGSLNLDDDTALPSLDTRSPPSSAFSLRDDDSVRSVNSHTSSFDAADNRYDHDDFFSRAESEEYAAIASATSEQWGTLEGNGSSQLTAMAARLTLV